MALVIITSTIAANTAQFGGGITLGDCTCSIVGSHIHGNTATTEGAGMYIAYSEVMIDNVTISENDAGYRGGGAYMYGSSSYPSNVNITQSIIKKNKITTSQTTSAYGGGGLQLNYNVNINIRETSFISNIANNNLGKEIFSRRSDSADTFYIHR